MTFDKRVYQSFPTDWLHKTVDNFGDEFRTNLRSPNDSWIPLHASFPITALLNDCRYGVRSTEVSLIVVCTHGDLLYSICKGVSESTNSKGSKRSEPMEYSEMRCSTSRCTVKMNWRTR